MCLPSVKPLFHDHKQAVVPQQAVVPAFIPFRLEFRETEISATSQGIGNYLCSKLYRILNFF
jgi:hypothetical protein